MAKNKVSPLHDKIAIAALHLAATHAWDKVTLEQIAKRAKISPEKLRAATPSKQAVVQAIISRVDAMLEKSFAKTAPTGTPRERLFEVIMARLDQLQKDRAGITSILKETKANPSSGAPMLPAVAGSMKSVLQLADIETGLPLYPAIIAGLGVVYALTLCTWMRDETRDISKTMAALDRSLAQAERVMAMIDARK